ncbi:hypothetical protein WJX74_009856 [Apatococcus lobatus]|uniref:BZIP domain-containing protein n=1 Tax=Apatococcus lobatus TaxID=904363 RepID=A0AAW1S7E8_9CHLO
MQGWKPLEPLQTPSLAGGATGCKGAFRYTDELARDSAFDGLDTTTSLGDLDLIGQLFPSRDSSQDIVSVPQPAPSSTQPAGPSGLPHSSSSGSSELPVRSSDHGQDPGHDADKADTKTAQARYRRRQKDKMADVEHKLEDLHHAIERRLEEQGSLLMQHDGLERDVAWREQQASKKPIAEVNGYARNVDASQILDFPTASGGMQQKSASEVAAMSQETFDQICQVYVQQLAALLLQANGDPLSPAGLQTTAVMQQASLLFCSRMRLNPVSMRSCVSSNRITPSVPEPTESLSGESWRGIADAMCLTKEQRQNLCHTRRLYLLRQGQLIRTRKHIITQIQESQSDAGAMTVVELIRKSGSDQELLKRLNANLEEDQTLFLQFCDKTKGEVLTAFQKAVMMVHTWPHPFDVLELANQIAHDSGEPTSQQLMEAPSQ